MRKLLIAGLMMVVGAATLAVTINDVGVDAWGESSPGASQSQVGMFIDFGGGDTVILGYRWNALDTVSRPPNSYSGAPVDANLGEAMLLALDVQTPLLLDYSYHNVFGFFLSEMGYGAGNIGAGGYPADYLGLWTSQDGASWEFSQGGVSALDLSTVEWVGWGRRTSDEFPAPQSEAPSAIPIPEPATAVLLGIAGLVALRRRSS